MHNETLGANARPTNTRVCWPWVDEVAALTKPNVIHWCDGSDEEWMVLWEQLAALSARLAILAHPAKVLEQA